MKKLKSDKTGPCPKRARILFILITLASLPALEACVPEMIAGRLTQREEAEAEVDIAALLPEAPADNAGGADAEAAAEGNVAGAVPNTTARLVLESGNYWDAGIPGFGENALSAFVGEYRIPGETERVNVWLTMEFIYYEGWTNRDSVNGITVLEKTLDDGRVVAAHLNEFWTAVLQLPLGTGLTGEEENSIVSGLVERFSGFSGQNRNVSLPALVEY